MASTIAQVILGLRRTPGALASAVGTAMVVVLVLTVDIATVVVFVLIVGIATVVVATWTVAVRTKVVGTSTVVTGNVRLRMTCVILLLIVVSLVCWSITVILTGEL